MPDPEVVRDGTIQRGDGAPLKLVLLRNSLASKGRWTSIDFVLGGQLLLDWTLRGANHPPLMPTSEAVHCTSLIYKAPVI